MKLRKREDGSYWDLTDPGEPVYEQPRVSITDEEGRLLAQLVTNLEVLEIGTGLGVSTRWMASLAQTVYTFDIDPWVKETVWPQLQLEHPNIVTLESLDDCPPVDAAFIDGCHETDQVRLDVEAALRLVRRPGLMIGHDAIHEKVLLALETAGPVEVIKTTHGLGKVQI